ncbi:hypothetical protein FA10DRAFT_265744 [Acaromyces ingoldii]|uniref:Protein ROT1 n=1 Tax=Acaromyces ingoldii TaxID=215250 RepID=A0A316YSZ4_9BASI|nr:hypothetical protein FA10DRAFT_265744 [Acaromyces ingoldii]PWN91924.1 hypothetical protein FA10DRAFT_265744 [Acaromyces ingoldii]
MAQAVTQQTNDDATIVGTWSSGSGAVTTGLQFYNPGNNTFNIPSVGGQSYSFTKDGFWEQALYIFTSDPTHPNCAQAQLIWQHGTFTQNSNGSLTLTPFEGDGRQLVQNGCTQQSQTLISYDQQEYMQGFYVRNDWHFGQGGIYLEMYEFDGTPKPWLWQTHNPPEMLPTQQLHKKIIGKVNGS